MKRELPDINQYDLRKLPNSMGYQFIATAQFGKFIKPRLFRQGDGLRVKTEKEYRFANGVNNWLGHLMVIPLTLSHFSMPAPLQFNEITCKVTLDKNIVETPVQGLNGTVKEYIADKDYTVELAGGITTLDTDGNFIDEYPKDGVLDLINVLKIQDALEVGSEFLTLFGITRLVVKNYSMKQEQHSNRQQFTINAVSDIPFVIKRRV